MTDDRVQVVSMTGEPVVTFQDDSIRGQLDGGGHLLIEAPGRGTRASTPTTWRRATSCG
ncbi:hypothetical protein [Nocardioides sp.]|uniref:hypothetical protein n=1 Tax=Nocardioides sp. TaxID=35761 RepID=UPI0026282BDE|nr:hypothetical protein [Nocardioides sp.]